MLSSPTARSFESNGFEILRQAQSRDVAVHHILFRVDTEVAVTRVRDDPTRGLSRDPTFVRDSNERLRVLRDALPVMKLELDTTQGGPDAIAADVMAALNLPTHRS